MPRAQLSFSTFTVFDVSKPTYLLDIANESMSLELIRLLLPRIPGLRLIESVPDIIIDTKKGFNLFVVAHGNKETYVSFANHVKYVKFLIFYFSNLLCDAAQTRKEDLDKIMKQCVAKYKEQNNVAKRGHEAAFDDLGTISVWACICYAGTRGNTMTDWGFGVDLHTFNFDSINNDQFATWILSQIPGINCNSYLD
jgi:hypothetical protein